MNMIALHSQKILKFKISNLKVMNNLVMNLLNKLIWILWREGTVWRSLKIMIVRFRMLMRMLFCRIESVCNLLILAYRVFWIRIMIKMREYAHMNLIWFWVVCLRDSFGKFSLMLGIEMIEFKVIRPKLLISIFN